MKKDYYENRSIVKSDIKKINFYFDEKNDSKTLEDVVYENSKIVLLGNPGVGKSKELENLFNILWDKNNDLGITPFSINLKNFRSINHFEDLLKYKDLQTLPQIIFILDGLDEISEIEGFLSALQIFMNKHQLSNYKYVISCRTNIYEKYLVNIADFETFYLEDLSIEQSESILKNKFDIDINKLKILTKHYQYLKTPFFLNLFAEYYLSNARLPDNDAKMWDAFVKAQLNKHKEKIKKIRLLNIPQEIKELKKVAFINELRQENFILNEDLNNVVKQNYLDFIENPFFVNLDNENEKFSFEHRQLQEYFVAKTLSEKSFEEIISIIRINESIQKVHPTLYNSVSFLINLLSDGEVRTNLINWIKVNQLELLIKADSDRIETELRIEVFQEYFNEICIKKTFWIGTDRTFSIDDIAKFGDCEANYDYLIDIIDNESIILRARISALNLISWFKIPNLKILKFKTFLINNLKSDKNPNQFKVAILSCVEQQKICINDDNFLTELISLFEKETSKEINVELLGIINEFENIDDYSDLIFSEFLLENNIEIRKDTDEVSRGTDFILNQLILKLKDSNKFINFAKYYFDIEKNIDIYINNPNELINKCLNFEANEKDFIIRLFKSINFENNFFYFQGALKELISKIGKKSLNSVFEYLLSNFLFDNINFALSTIVNNENIWEVINIYETKLIAEQNQIENFRNAVANNSSRELGQLFNDEMIKKGFTFKEEFITQKNIEEISWNIEKKPQKNFDILFNKEKLKKEFELIFEQNGFEITRERHFEIHHEWYVKNAYNTEIDTPLEILRKIIYESKRPIVINDVLKYIENEDFIITEIISDLENKNRKANILNISNNQKLFIEKWVQKKIEIIDFNSIIQNKKNGFIPLKDFDNWRNIIFFSKKLDIELPQDFLLNSLIIPDVNNKVDITIFDYLKLKISDKNLFENKIKENLKKSDIYYFTLKNHIDYALENKLQATYSDIKIHLDSVPYKYDLKPKLELLYTLEKDIFYLKGLTTNLNSSIAWDAISILFEEEYSTERDFCENKSIEYLFHNDDDNDKYFISTALNILFKCNSIKAVEYYLKYLNTDFSSSIFINSFNNYNAISDFSILSDFFNNIYINKNKERGFNYTASFFNQYISNLSSKDDFSFKKVQNQLNEIRTDLEVAKNDNGIFYINLLIDKSNNSYYNFKSIKLNFNDALKKVNEIIH